MLVFFSSFHSFFPFFAILNRRVYYMSAKLLSLFVSSSNTFIHHLSFPRLSLSLSLSLSLLSPISCLLSPVSCLLSSVSCTLALSPPPFLFFFSFFFSSEKFSRPYEEKQKQKEKALDRLEFSGVLVTNQSNFLVFILNFFFNQINQEMTEMSCLSCLSAYLYVFSIFFFGGGGGGWGARVEPFAFLRGFLMGGGGKGWARHIRIFSYF